MGRKYLIDSWVGAADPDEYSGEQLGRRRRSGGSSRGFIYDRTTGHTFPESSLYNGDGTANVQLFAQLDGTRAATERLWKAAKQKRIDIDLLDELSALLHKHRLDISPDDYQSLHYQLESKRDAAFLASLPPDEREEHTKAEQLEYVRANADKFPLLALSLGIQPSPAAMRKLEREGLIEPSGIDWWEVVKTILVWLFVAVFTLKIFLG